MWSQTLRLEEFKHAFFEGERREIMRMRSDKKSLLTRLLLASQVLQTLINILESFTTALQKNWFSFTVFEISCHTHSKSAFNSPEFLSGVYDLASAT